MNIPCSAMEVDWSCNNISLLPCFIFFQTVGGILDTVIVQVLIFFLEMFYCYRYLSSLTVELSLLIIILLISFPYFIFRKKARIHLKNFKKTISSLSDTFMVMSLGDAVFSDWTICYKTSDNIRCLRRAMLPNQLSSGLFNVCFLVLCSFSRLLLNT